MSIAVTTLYRRIAVLAVFATLGGCIVPLYANLRNDSGQPLYHLTDWRPFEEPIPPGETRKVQLIWPGACIELVVDGTSRFFEVPEPPDGIERTRHWNPRLPVVMTSDGLFYEHKGELRDRFGELASCEHQQSTD